MPACPQLQSLTKVQPQYQLERFRIVSYEPLLLNEQRPWLTEHLPYRGNPDSAGAASEAADQPGGL